MNARSSRFALTSLLDVLLILLFALSISQARSMRSETDEVKGALEQTRVADAERLAGLEFDLDHARARNKQLVEVVEQAEIFNNLDEQERSAFARALAGKLTMVYLYLRANRITHFRPYHEKEERPFRPAIQLFLERDGVKVYRGGVFGLVDDLLPNHLSQKFNPTTVIYLFIPVENEDNTALIDGLAQEYRGDPKLSRRPMILPGGF